MRGRVSIKGGKDVYAEGWKVESGNNPVVPWYTSSRT